MPMLNQDQIDATATATRQFCEDRLLFCNTVLESIKTDPSEANTEELNRNLFGIEIAVRLKTLDDKYGDEDVPVATQFTAEQIEELFTDIKDIYDEIISKLELLDDQADVAEKNIIITEIIALTLEQRNYSNEFIAKIEPEYFKTAYEYLFPYLFASLGITSFNENTLNNWAVSLEDPIRLKIKQQLETTNIEFNFFDELINTLVVNNIVDAKDIVNLDADKPLENFVSKAYNVKDQLDKLITSCDSSASKIKHNPAVSELLKTQVAALRAQCKPYNEILKRVKAKLKTENTLQNKIFTILLAKSYQKINSAAESLKQEIDELAMNKPAQPPAIAAQHAQQESKPLEEEEKSATPEEALLEKIAAQNRDARKAKFETKDMRELLFRQRQAQNLAVANQNIEDAAITAMPLPKKSFALLQRIFDPSESLHLTITVAELRALAIDCGAEVSKDPDAPTQAFKFKNHHSFTHKAATPETLGQPLDLTRGTTTQQPGVIPIGFHRPHGRAHNSRTLNKVYVTQFVETLRSAGITPETCRLLKASEAPRIL